MPRFALRAAPDRYPYHSARFVLVERQTRIRGYYHSDEEAALRRLRRDVRTVLRESWTPISDVEKRKGRSQTI